MNDLQTISGLNLDAAAREEIEPYTFVIDGRVLTFTDPSHLEWQLLENMTNLDVLAEKCMTAEDRAYFYKTPLAGWKLGLLFEDVQRHFRLGEHASKRR